MYQVNQFESMLCNWFFNRLCWEKFGWSTQKADELLLPVLKEYNKREVDSSLSISCDGYYSYIWETTG